MTTNQAKRLASHMNRNGRSARVSRGRLVFSGGTYGEHSLALSHTSLERALSHWQGYAGIEGKETGLVAFMQRRSRSLIFVGRLDRVVRCRSWPNAGLVVRKVRRVYAGGETAATATESIGLDDAVTFAL
jgi:hypothetical protein